jgi:hypothetical protein
MQKIGSAAGCAVLFRFAGAGDAFFVNGQGVKDKALMVI